MIDVQSRSEKPSREFQVFVKPVGAICNLNCHYCYYLDKEQIYDRTNQLKMSESMLEDYIIQHIKASTEEFISFSWHGGEPTIYGIDLFRRVVELQRKNQLSDRVIVNGIQTNGTLLNEEWCEFLAEEDFLIGISIDGPEEFHDQFRLTKDRKSSFAQTIHGYHLLQKFKIPTEILCVVNTYNAKHPLEIYRFFKTLGAKFITFLPLVEKCPGTEDGVSPESVRPKEFGNFLCAIFDEWIEKDIGEVKIQLFEEATRVAFHQGHTLCIFKKVCGGVPVVEHNGDFYCCDHYVDPDHHLGNIKDRSLTDFLDSPEQMAFGQAKLTTLPEYCRQCEVLDMCNGECPKNRIILTPDGEKGLNYLCEGYKKFFTHCRPFVNEVAMQWQKQFTNQQEIKNKTEPSPLRSVIGRNDLCPCGSGRKYKNCCMLSS